MISYDRVQELKIIAARVRESIIEMLVSAGSGHTAGPLGFTDVLVALYFQTMKHNPKNPSWEHRDRFLLSHGHICPALYATMAHAGYFSKAELLTLRSFGSRLQGHPHREYLPGIETSSGPLGCGISQGVGMALGLQLQKNPARVFVGISDGELQEGNTWEALMLAAHYKLTNFVIILDRNHIQIDGFTENIVGLDPVADKMRAFNYEVAEVDGHNFEELEKVLHQKNTSGRPLFVIAHTTPGKGVKAFENKFEWHGKPPVDKEAYDALASLRSLEGALVAPHHH
ncbi:MAG TPA: transketolase [Candidatus Paceibacterota bacterium]